MVELRAALNHFNHFNVPITMSYRAPQWQIHKQNNTYISLLFILSAILNTARTMTAPLFSRSRSHKHDPDSPEIHVVIDNRERGKTNYIPDWDFGILWSYIAEERAFCGIFIYFFLLTWTPITIITELKSGKFGKTSHLSPNLKLM